MSNLPAQILNASPTLRRLAGPIGSQQSVAQAGVNLNHASEQWGKRPADERFWTLADAAQAARERDSRLTLRDIRPQAARVGVLDNAPALIHISSGNAAPLLPVAAQQLARAAGAPLSYLQTLPAELAAQCLDHGWQRFAAGRNGDSPMRLQVLAPRIAGSPNAIRALTTPTHDLTHDSQLLSALARIVADGSGWKVPPARVPAHYEGQTRTATEADCLHHAGTGLSPRPGDELAPSGVYLGDRDSFALIVDDSDAGRMEVNGRPMSRFLTVSNCEVGLGSLEIITGWLDGICGNHILWNCSNIVEIKAVHRGSNATRSVHRLAYQIEARAWNDDRAKTAAHFQAMAACSLATNKAELIDLLFKKKILGRAQAEDAVEISHELAHLDGTPLRAWSTMQAITRMSQASRHMSDRQALDLSAVKVAELVSVN